jgi:hypothetical protein
MKSFPIVNKEKCINPSNLIRSEFLTDCIPLMNLKNNKYNILNWTNDKYMYYDPNNNENLVFNIPSDLNTNTNTNIDFSLNLYKGRLPNFIQDDVIKELEKHCCKNLSIKETDISIPVYYLFTNKNNAIFNIFITQYKLLFDKEKNNKILTNLFQYFKETNQFVKFSYKFNIFNISLL